MHSQHPARRQFLQRLAALAPLGLVPALLGDRLASALVPLAVKKRFVFVVNRGGWDPLTVFAPLFGRSQIAMPALAEAATAHGVPYVASVQRPSVSSFFDTFGGRCLLVHGLSVRSVSHEVCEFTMMTGHATGDVSDHGSRLAERDPDVALPHLVLSGPTYPGPLSALVARSGATGQLQELISGELRLRSDQSTTGLTTPASRLVNDFVLRRSRAAADAGPSPRRAAIVEALGRAERLADLRYDVSFKSDGSFPSQLDIALQVLSRGIAQCVTVSPPLAWDSHTDSDNQQSPLFESLFAGLNTFMARLQSTQDTTGRNLSENTVVVVLSEMGRTPQLNSDQGRDHWPYTSAMLIGPGLTGGRVVGGYDDGYSGLGIDPATGELDPKRPATTPAQLGATLLALADLDPTALGPGVEPLLGVLA